MPDSDRSAPERQRRGKKSHQTYMKKLKERFLKDNQEAQMPLKEFIDYFQQDLNDPASTLIAIEETMRIMKEEHNTEINISIRGTEHAENLQSISLWTVRWRDPTSHFHHVGRFSIK